MMRYLILLALLMCPLSAWAGCLAVLNPFTGRLDCGGTPGGVSGLVSGNGASISCGGGTCTVAISTTVPELDQANTYTAGAKQTMSQSATTAGLNLGAVGSAPSAPAQGDVWYDTSTGIVYRTGSASLKLMEDPFTTQGDIVYRGASAPTRLAAPGGAGYFMGYDSVGGAPQWQALAYTDIPATNIPTPGTSISLTAPGGMAFCTGTCNVTLPVPAAGYQFCARNSNNVSTQITLVNITGVSYEATARTSYYATNRKLVSGGAVTDQICVVGLDATHYAVLSSTGTWTDTAP